MFNEGKRWGAPDQFLPSQNETTR